MFRATCWNRCGGCRNGDFPEDYELWLRWLELGVGMAKVPKVLFRWNDDPSRLTRTDPRYRPEAFYRIKAEYLANWLEARGTNRRILIWGAGRVTRQRVAFLEERGVAVDGFIDVDAKKWGRLRDGRRVIRPEETPPPVEVFVIGYVAKREAHATIRSGLTALGFREGEDFILAA
jgi:hypothetical protein